MPQMAPISWITLYMFFTILFLMMCIVNYYIFLYNPTNKIVKQAMNYSWKW
uniref:ATP synthase complex subunit 8 n=1 Tax=Xylosandrus crassiusculus TaxID=124033 RepID=A0A343A696_9CUCU|nr:ATP synthase F0 subunit 8 [Xylosandrus crassiusculus]AOY40075.1 ATP synthase F0 subunit 8 [Xylosandrus crassiusculus]